MREKEGGRRGEGRLVPYHLRGGGGVAVTKGRLFIECRYAFYISAYGGGEGTTKVFMRFFLVPPLSPSLLYDKSVNLLADRVCFCSRGTAV